MTMKSKVPFITYQLDKPRTARLTISNMIKLNQMGINLLQLASKQEVNLQKLDFPIEEMIKTFYVCFKDETLTEDELGDLIMEYSNLQEAMGKMFELINNAMPFITGATEEELTKIKEEKLAKLAKVESGQEPDKETEQEGESEPKN